jgi:hypothetical protein
MIMKISSVQWSNYRTSDWAIDRIAVCHIHLLAIITLTFITLGLHNLFNIYLDL